MGQDSDPATMGQPHKSGGVVWGRRSPHGANVDPVEHKGLLWGRTFLCPIGISMALWSTGPTPHPTGVPMGRGVFLGFLGTHLSRRSGPSPTTSQRSPRTAAVTRSRPTRSWGPARASATVTRATSSPPRAPGGSHCPPNVTACGFGDKKYFFF